MGYDVCVAIIYALTLLFDTARGSVGSLVRGQTQEVEALAPVWIAGDKLPLQIVLGKNVPDAQGLYRLMGEELPVGGSLKMIGRATANLTSTNPLFLAETFTPGSSTERGAWYETTLALDSTGLYDALEAAGTANQVSCTVDVQVSDATGANRATYQFSAIARAAAALAAEGVPNPSVTPNGALNRYTAPDGTVWGLTVGNGGILSVTQIL